MESTLQTTGPITPALIHELSPRLLAFAHRAMPERADAEDVVQETWISALRSVHRFQERSSMATWVTTILRRRIADRYLRRRITEPLYEESVQALEQSPELLLQWRELSSLTGAALAALTEQERRAVLLCDVEDLDRDEACAQLGVSRTHLRVLLHRARHKLQGCLKAEHTP